MSIDLEAVRKQLVSSRMAIVARDAYGDFDDGEGDDAKWQRVLSAIAKEIIAVAGYEVREAKPVSDEKTDDLIEIMARARAESDWGEPIPDHEWARYARKHHEYMASAIAAAEAAGYEIRKVKS